MKQKRLTVFWGNEKVSHAAIMEVQRAETLKRLAGLRRVLLVQDTTSFNFTHHPATTGLGRLENEHCQGFLAHSTLAVSEAGVPLGLLAQKVWARGAERVRDQRHTRPFAEKESYKWVQGLPDEADLPENMTAIVVCDAEAHIYAFLDVLKERHLGCIVRAADYRSFTEQGAALFDEVSAQTVAEVFEITLQRRPDRAARTAQVALRFGSVTLKCPKSTPAQHDQLTMTFVDVLEINPPADETGIHWLLLTSLPVTHDQEALQIVVWYKCRWLIERLHYVLKSGCKLEERQLREEKRLERLLAIYSRVAWHLLWMTYQARSSPDAPARWRYTTPNGRHCTFLRKKPASCRPNRPPCGRRCIGLGS